VVVLAIAAERPFSSGHGSGLFVTSDVDTNSAAIGLFVDGALRLSSCVVTEASALITDADWHA
jgi:hypothetical protein